MSHITTLTVQIRDISALAAAVREFGGTLVRDQKTFTAYRNNNNPCEHVITLPGVKYQIGVVKAEKGGYTLAFDPYGAEYDGSKDDGHKLLQKFGDGLKKLVQSYAVSVATLKAKASGWMVSKQTLANGSVKLTLSGV